MKRTDKAFAYLAFREWWKEIEKGKERLAKYKKAGGKITPCKNPKEKANENRD